MVVKPVASEDGGVLKGVVLLKPPLPLRIEMASCGKKIALKNISVTWSIKRPSE